MALGLIALVLTTYRTGGMGSVKIGVILGIGAGTSVRHRVHADLGDVRRRRPVAGDDPATFRACCSSSPCNRSTRRRSLRCGCRHGRGRSRAGSAGGVAIASLKLGYINGSAGPVSVAASQFAAVAVVLSVIFNKERLRPWQAVGVAAGGVGVALMALG